ncbi:conjugal transfer protein [Scatolibacter rhodanostii]|uniref:conjugal transfer protein n=1 Tax=Scatolibacter rhodanostii TaxID=2014781 RepID=UPI000C07DB4D|nr:conjugal transfer protein [Scatolibacter rhodanostii]
MKIQIIPSEKKPKVKKEKPVKEKKVKEKRVPIKRVGTRRKSVVFMWCLLVFSLVFAIYKNFTAVDMRTEIKETVIEQKVTDTNAVESFVQDFAETLYTWNPKNLPIRAESLKNYLIEDLQKINADMVREDIPTTSEVSQVKVWNVEEVNEHSYDVLISVLQYITEYQPTVEAKPEAAPMEVSNQYVETAYIVSVYVDDSGNMVIDKNPMVTAKPEKTSKEPKKIESDGSVSSDTMQEINKFLETFFMLYPSAGQDELAYYVSNNVIKPIEKDYLFSGLQNQTYQMKDDTIFVGVMVKYLDQETKCIQYLQYDLKLQKSHNWVIVGKGEGN